MSTFNNTKMRITSVIPGRSVNTYLPGNTAIYAEQFANFNNLASKAVTLIDAIVVDSIYGDDTTGNNKGSPYLTIEAAVNASLSGSIIYVRAGTYTLTSENLSIPIGVSIIGIDSKNTIINYTTKTSCTMFTIDQGCLLKDITFNLTTKTDNLSLIGLAITKD